MLLLHPLRPPRLQTSVFVAECGVDMTTIMTHTSRLSLSGSYSISSSSMSILRGSTGSCFTTTGAGGGGEADFGLRSRSARGSEGGTRGAVGGGVEVGCSTGVALEGPAGGGVGERPGIALVTVAFLCRYACTRPMSAFSVNACKFATIKSVTRVAGRALKSKPAGAAGGTSCSSLTRFASGGSMTGVADA